MKTGSKIAIGALVIAGGAFLLSKLGGKEEVEYALTAGANDIAYTGEPFKGKKLFDSIGDYIVGLVYYRLPEWSYWDDVTPETVIYDRSIIHITVSEDCILRI